MGHDRKPKLRQHVRHRTSIKRQTVRASLLLFVFTLVVLSFGFRTSNNTTSSVVVPVPGDDAQPDLGSSSPPFDAIVVLGGGQTPGGPPPHVVERLELAAKLYDDSAGDKPFVIVTGRGTTHKPCPRDGAGFERTEASDNARHLMERGVDPSRILEESVSLETVGNAFFARVIHTDLRGLRRLAIINNEFHMPRTRAVFDHVFSVPPTTVPYELVFFEVSNALPRGVLRARREREAQSLPKFADGGPWRAATPTLTDLHAWVFEENTAYASRRLVEESDEAPVDPKVLNSY